MKILEWMDPTRWLMAIGMAAALWFGYMAWADHQQGIGYDKAQAEYAVQAKKADDKREAVAPVVEAAHQKALAKIVTVTQTIIKEVPIYVKATDCAMPGGFRVLHDAAAHGTVPDPGAVADAANAGDYAGACRGYLEYKFIRINGKPYDCSTPGNRVCSGVWKRSVGRYDKCMGDQ